MKLNRVVYSLYEASLARKEASSDERYELLS